MTQTLQNCCGVCGLLPLPPCVRKKSSLRSNWTAPNGKKPNWGHFIIYQGRKGWSVIAYILLCDAESAPRCRCTYRPLNSPHKGWNIFLTLRGARILGRSSLILLLTKTKTYGAQCRIRYPYSYIYIYIVYPSKTARGSERDKGAFPRNILGCVNNLLPCKFFFFYIIQYSLFYKMCVNGVELMKTWGIKKKDGRCFKL